MIVFGMLASGFFRWKRHQGPEQQVDPTSDCRSRAVGVYLEAGVPHLGWSSSPSVTWTSPLPSAFAM